MKYIPHGGQKVTSPYSYFISTNKSVHQAIIQLNLLGFVCNSATRDAKPAQEEVTLILGNLSGE